ncbi:MAG: hypothetical protein GY754_38490 [bacterium]|nr:hypothetical protein [bacterium]
MPESVKDKRINIRIDEDTYEALQVFVKEELNTDISAFCRSILSTIVLHDTIIKKIKKAVSEISKRDTTSLEYMLEVYKGMSSMNSIKESMTKGRAEMDSLIELLDSRNRAISEEMKQYFDIYNKYIDELDTNLRNYYEDYENDPTVMKPGKRIIIE